MVSLSLYLFVMHQINNTEYLTTINQPIRELLTASKSPDVVFIVHNPNNSEIIDSIYRTVSRISPTTLIHLNRSDTNLSFHVSRRSLILYLYFSKSPPDVNETQEIGNILSREETRQKVLLITFVEERDCDFESFFEQLWRQQLLNVAILELPRFQEKSSMMVHRYNPFSKVYDRREYTSGVEFFPDKTRDLHGYPTRILLFPRAGVPNVTTNAEGRIVTTPGPDIKVLETFAHVLNFTADFVYFPTFNNPLYHIMTAEDIDVSLLLPIFDPHTIEYTVPMNDEKWCAIVPINYPFKVIELQAVTGMFINYLIVITFWAISRMLRLDRELWQPLKIFGMILCMAVPIKPSKTVEKCLIVGIFLASSFLSTHLYADLTTSHIKGADQTVYKDFKDLDKSGLIPVVLKPLANVTFLHGDESFLALKEKTVTTSNMTECVQQLDRYRNVTCLMEKKWASILIYSYSKRGENRMVVSKHLCYVSPRVAYFTKKNSPIVERMSEIVMRLKESGVEPKWHMDYIGKFSERKTHLMKVNEENKPSLVGKLTPLVISGFFLSVVVFWVEILLDRNEHNEE